MTAIVLGGVDPIVGRVPNLTDDEMPALISIDLIRSAEDSAHDRAGDA